MLNTNFCKKCGAKVELCGIGGTHKECVCCGEKYYDNPIVGVSGVYINKGKILLGKRKGSYRDLWCIPCGYLEREDVVDGMKREFKEETNLDVIESELYTVESNFHNIDEISLGVFYYIKEVKGNLEAKDDLKEVRYFGKDELPNLAFPSDIKVIKNLIEKEQIR